MYLWDYVTYFAALETYLTSTAGASLDSQSSNRTASAPQDPGFVIPAAVTLCLLPRATIN